MDIVLVNQSTSYLMIDIANAYAKKYDNVILIAGSVTQFDRPLSSKIKIKRIRRYNKCSIFSRVYTWFVAFVQIVWKIRISYKDAYIVYVTNPPISYFATLFCRNRFSIIEYDIYPDALKNVGLGESNIIYRMYGLINRKIFGNAIYIYIPLAME